MFLRRAGIDLSPGTKRLLWASFLLSYALALLTLHGDPNAPSYGPEITGWTYRFLELGIAPGLYRSLFLSAGVLYVGTLVLTAWQLRHARSALLPAAMLVVTQALWFSVPSAFVWLTGSSLPAIDVAFLFVWIAAGHAIQYLWITTYYAARDEGTVGRAGFLGKSLLAGAMIWTLPALAFAPAALGTTPYGLGLFMLVASAVNLHHFVLDGAIWKLRDGPVARILLGRKDAAAGETAAAADTGSRFGKPFFLGLGAACLAITIGGSMLQIFALPGALAAGDGARAKRIEDWLALIGRDEPSHLTRRAFELARAGDLDRAAETYHASLTRFPTPDAWLGIGELRLVRGDRIGAREAARASLDVLPTPGAWSMIGMVENDLANYEAAGEAFDRSIELGAHDAAALYRHGDFWLQRGDAEKAIASLERAERIAPDYPGVREALMRAHRLR
jgi:hypothetical protein